MPWQQLTRGAGTSTRVIISHQFIKRAEPGMIFFILVTRPRSSFGLFFSPKLFFVFLASQFPAKRAAHHRPDQTRMCDLDDFPPRGLSTVFITTVQCVKDKLALTVVRRMTTCYEVLSTYYSKVVAALSACGFHSDI